MAPIRVLENVIDAHAHLPADEAQAQALLEALGTRVLNISLGLDSRGEWRASPMSGTGVYGKLAAERSSLFGWCTGFDLPNPEEVRPQSDYPDRVIQALRRDFDHGAMACKVWKNVGMEVKDAAGAFVMVDHELFTPIFEFIEKMDRVLIMHIGEPRACWEPLDPRSPHYGYYAEHPQWHMFGRDDFPSHEELMAARDRTIERHPGLRIVGAHLASLEYSVDAIEERLARFSNFSVDTAERLLDLTLHPRERVQQLFARRADRILFGSDLLFDQAFSQMTPVAHQDALERVRQTLEQELAYYSADAEVVVRGRTVPGLALGPSVLKQVFFDNAARCFGWAR